MDLTLKDDVTEAFSVVLKDKFGAVTAADQPLTVASSDESIAVGTLSADGSTLEVASAGAGKLGAATITVSDAADNLAAAINVTIIAGSPASIELTPVVPAAAAAPVAPAAAAAPAPADAAPAPAAAPVDAAAPAPVDAATPAA